MLNQFGSRASSSRVATRRHRYVADLDYNLVDGNDDGVTDIFDGDLDGDDGALSMTTLDAARGGHGAAATMAGGGRPPPPPRPPPGSNGGFGNGYGGGFNGDDDAHPTGGEGGEGGEGGGLQRTMSSLKRTERIGQAERGVAILLRPTPVRHMTSPNTIYITWHRMPRHSNSCSDRRRCVRVYT